MVVTGGGRGIGAQVVRQLVAAGSQVVFSYLSNQQAAEALCEELGTGAHAVRADVADSDQVALLFNYAVENLGAVEGLVNNAGIVGYKQRLDEMSAERLQQMFDTNVLGLMYCCQAASRVMSTRYGGQGGAIVNVSSAAARIGSPGEYVDYAASKGAVDTLTVGLAKELAEEGVRVNGVRPGIINTDIHASGGQPDRAQRLQHLIPMQRPGEAEEVAQSICWLLSAQASYCTGAILDVSGGR